MATKIYAAPETAITFKDSDTTYTIGLNGLDHGVGRLSDQWDRGTGSKPVTHRVRVKVTMAGAHATVVGTTLDVYMATSDGTNVDGTAGTSDAALTAARASNLTFVGSVVADVAATAETVFVGSFTVNIFERYVQFGIINNTADALKATNDTSTIVVTPYPDESQ